VSRLGDQGDTLQIALGIDAGRARHWRQLLTLTLAGVLAATACSASDDDDGADDAGDTATTTAPELPAGYSGHTSAIYADDANWLCKPGIADDVCGRDLDATAVAADGSTEVIEHEAADDPPVDCFYVYPTISRDPGPNSDLVPAEGEEIFTAYNQVARLTSTCRVYAPVYRQITLSQIGGGGSGFSGDAPAVAYGDVVDSFKHYVANESDGRGFVLLGHSQGAGVITRLIQDEIDDEPLLRDRLVAAYVLGSSLQVPDGEVVGGDFANVPLCEAEDQTGCVVTYSSYRAAEPPPAGGFFGRDREGSVAACVNPAAIGGAASVQPYFLVRQAPDSLLGGSSAQPFADPARTAEITTPWVTYPDLVEAECVRQPGHTYLALSVNGDPADPRTDDIGGDLTPEWGMHLVDANIEMGDIEDLVAAQAGAYVR
jgi:pimeloyl-ACP methyl ester carboxylesterase